MKKLLARLKSKKQSKKDLEKERQRIYSKLTSAIDASLNDKSKVIEADLKMRRSLSVLSLRPKSDTIVSRRESFAEKASKLTEIEIAHLSKNQKRKIRSLNTSSLKLEDLVSLRNSISALEAILHPDEATKTLENNIRRSKRLTKDFRSMQLFHSKQKDLNATQADNVDQEQTACSSNCKMIENKAEQKPLNQQTKSERTKEDSTETFVNEVHNDGYQEEEYRTRRLQEKLAKLRKMEKQLEEEEEARSRFENTQEQLKKIIDNQDINTKEIQHQQEMQHNIKEKEEQVIQNGNVDIILSKLKQNDFGLKKLDLTGKNIGNENCSRIMQALHENKILHTLILRNNNLDNHCLESTCEMLRHNVTLHTLDLSNNFITRPDCIVETLQHNFHLCNLELGQYASEDTLDEMEEYLERNYKRREAK